MGACSEKNYYIYEIKSSEYKHNAKAVYRAMFSLSLKKATEAVAWKCSVKKGVLRNFAKFTGKHLYQSLFFNKVDSLLVPLKETLAQAFSCEFFEIFKNTFS